MQTMENITRHLSEDVSFDAVSTIVAEKNYRAHLHFPPKFLTGEGKR